MPPVELRQWALRHHVSLEALAELSALRRFAGPMIEMGRFCIHPAAQDPDILRLAWVGNPRESL